MGIGNTKIGLPWPAAARNAEIWSNRNPSSVDLNLNGIQNGRISNSSQHAAGDIERTFAITKIWGIAHKKWADPHHHGEATTGWLKFPLWIMSKSTGGYPYVFDKDVELFYLQHVHTRSNTTEWAPQLYVTYSAKNETQIYAFNASSGRASEQDGYAPQGGFSSGREMTGSEADREEGWTRTVPGTTPAAANEARLVFVQAQMETNRWESDFSKQRAEMDAIANNTRGSVTSVPPGTRNQSTGGIDGQIQDALLSAGYTQNQIDWYTSGGLTDPTRNGLWSGSQADSASPPDGAQDHHISPPTPAVTRLVVRAPIGYVQPSGEGDPSGKPEMTQVFMQFNDSNFKLESKVDRFFFPVIPNTVSYSGLGSRWVEIPRKGDFPVVEFSDWALMKVQFEFLVTHEMDGLFADVHRQLNQLRRMAQRRNPVSIYGMDNLFHLQMKRAQNTHKALQFVIADFTIQSQRRTVNPGDKEITVAQCSITLQEMPIEEMNLVSMSIPPLADSSVPATPDVDIDDITNLDLERSTQILLAVAGIDTGSVTG